MLHLLIDVGVALSVREGEISIIPDIREVSHLEVTWPLYLLEPFRRGLLHRETWSSQLLRVALLDSNTDETSNVLNRYRHHLAWCHLAHPEWTGLRILAEAHHVGEISLIEEHVRRSETNNLPHFSERHLIDQEFIKTEWNVRSACFEIMREEANWAKWYLINGVVRSLCIRYHNSNCIFVCTLRKWVVLFSPELACNALLVVNFNLQRVSIFYDIFLQVQYPFAWRLSLSYCFLHEDLKAWEVFNRVRTHSVLIIP